MSKSKYTSNATWTKIKPSHDTHESYYMAKGICEKLVQDYGTHNPPCEVRGHCLEAWVENENGDKVA